MSESKLRNDVEPQTGICAFGPSALGLSGGVPAQVPLPAQMGTAPAYIPGPGQAAQYWDRGIFQATLQPVHIHAINLDLERKSLLGQPFREPDPAQVLTDNHPDIQDRSMLRWPDLLRGYGKIYPLASILLFTVLTMLAGARLYRQVHGFIRVHLDRLNDGLGLSLRRAPA